MRTRILLVAIAAVVSTATAQQPAQKVGGVAVVQTYKGKAVVLYVDDLAHNVTVTINGQLHNYTLADSVKGIMQIKAGDTLNIETVEEMQGTITALNPSVREMSVRVNKDTLSFVADTSLHNYSRLKVGESVV